MDLQDNNAPVVPVAIQDFLDQDPPLRGQKYACVSFVSPEDIIMRKDVFEFHKFMQAIRRDVDQLLEALLDKYAGESFVSDMVSGIRERHEYLYSPESMKQELDAFIAANADKINQEFSEQVQFRTSIRGFKIRGTFETLVEAKARAEKIRSFDKNFNVYVAEVGCWCPWSPNPDEIADNEYSESHLNTLMKRYRDNEAMRAEFYEKRKEALVSNATASKTCQENQDQAEPVVDVMASSTDVQAMLEQPDPWMARQQLPVEHEDVPMDKAVDGIIQNVVSHVLNDASSGDTS